MHRARAVLNFSCFFFVFLSFRVLLANAQTSFPFWLAITIFFSSGLNLDLFVT